MTDIKVLQSGNIGQCLSLEQIARARNEIFQITNTTIIKFNTCGTPGWRRVVFVNMTDTSYNCPTGLRLTSYSKRTCGRSHTSAGCSSTTFSFEGIPYSRMCGRIRGYEFGDTGAFATSSVGIDSYYVDGVSLTYGVAGRRQHIWIFAAGLSEVTTHWPDHGCPCDAQTNNRVPQFVANDYFCESGYNKAWSYNYTLYSDDILWDGQDCTSTSTCCQFNNPPWFTKNLTSATTDDIELRICANHGNSKEDTALELIELYIK